MAGAIHACPQCGSQLEVRLVFASGPKSATENHDDFDLDSVMAKIDRDNLSGRDLEFYDDFKVKYDKYRSKTMVSDKQKNWLTDLSERGF